VAAYTYFIAGKFDREIASAERADGETRQYFRSGIFPQV
jgi:hypothetical protein